MGTSHSTANCSTPRRYTYAWILKKMLQRPMAVICTVFLLTFFWGLEIHKLEFRFSLSDLVMEKSPAAKTYNRYLRTFGSQESLRIIVKSKNIYDPYLLESISHVSAALRKIPGVARVVSLAQLRDAVAPAASYDPRRFKEIITSMELFRGEFFSKDGHRTAINVILAGDADRKMIVEQLMNILEKENIKKAARLMGMPVLNLAMTAMGHKTVFFFVPLILLFATLILALTLRKLVPLILMTVCILFSQVWSLGILSLLGTPIYLPTLMAPLFLVAVQIFFGLHVMAMYTSGRNNATGTEAVLIGFSRVPLPFSLSIATTIGILLSFLFNPIDAVYTFGSFTCWGLFSFFLLMLTFFPVALCFFPLSQSKKISEPKSAWTNRLPVIFDLASEQRRYLLPTITALTILAIIGLFQIKTETLPLTLFNSKGGILPESGELKGGRVGMFPIGVILKNPHKNYFLKPQNLVVLDRFKRYLKNLPEVDRAVSFTDYLKLNAYAQNNFAPETYKLPETPLNPVAMADAYPNLIDRNILKRYMRFDFSEANIILFTRPTDARQLIELRNTILEHARRITSFDTETEVTGIDYAIIAGSNKVIRDQIKALIISLAMVFGILWFLVISIKAGLMLALPVIFSVIFTFGLMGWFGIPLTILSTLIATTAISLTAGNVLYYLVTYTHQFKKDLNNRRAQKTTLEMQGIPIFNASIALAVGFIALLASGFTPLYYAGLIMPLVLASVLAANLVLLPGLLHQAEIVTIWDLLRVKVGKTLDKEIPLFNGLARHQIRSIFMAGTLQKLAPREALFNKGDMSDTMYAIVSGSLDIINFRKFEDSNGVHEIQKVVNRLYAGDVVGEMGFFRSTRRSATVIATESTELLQINWHMIRRLQWLYPLTAQKFFINLMGIICDRLEIMTNALCDQSLVDDLTGLFNKKGFTQLLETEADRAQRYHEELTLCLIGLDLKNKISLSNPETTEVMIRTACQMISREIRRTDILSRIDTSTFAMVAPKTSQPQANILCQRLRQVLNRNLLGFGAPSLTVRLAAANLIHNSRESGMELLERSLSKLQSTQE